MRKYRSNVSTRSRYLESKKLKESVNEFAFEEITGKAWDEYVKGILEKLKAEVKGYEDEDKDDVTMILEVMIDEATELADGSFEDYQKLAILHLFEEKIDDLETLNKVLKDFGIEEIEDDDEDIDDWD